MDRQGQNQNPPMGVVGSIAQRSLGFIPTERNPIMTGGPGSVGMQSTGGQPARAQLSQQQQQQLQEQLQAFWVNQQKESENVTDFNKHGLSLTRIKNIMKADEDVRMISGEAPVLFAKACEMFILDLTLRSWNHGKSSTVQKNDMAAAVSVTDYFDFLVDTVPLEKPTDLSVFQIIGADEEVQEEAYD